MCYDIKKCAEHIRQLRKQNGYTQEGLAEVLSIDRSILSRIETDKYACSVSFLAQIADFFDVSLDYLVFGKVQNRETAQLKLSISNLIQDLEQFKESI